MIKAILAYDIAPGVTEVQYEDWLWNIHVPDRLANPFLGKIVFNTVVRPVREGEVYYRIAELHYQSLEDFERYVTWNEAHPTRPDRTSRGRTDLKFYLLCDVKEANRDNLTDWGDRSAPLPTACSSGPTEVKGILGYNIVQGITVPQYEEWLWKIHAPDLLSNPHLQRIVFDTVIKPLRGERSFYRVAELHYESAESYQQYLDWARSHPIAEERTPKGRTEFLFYLLCSVREVSRQDTAAGSYS